MFTNPPVDQPVVKVDNGIDSCRTVAVQEEREYSTPCRRRFGSPELQALRSLILGVIPLLNDSSPILRKLIWTAIADRMYKYGWSKRNWISVRTRGKKLLRNCSPQSWPKMSAHPQSESSYGNAYKDLYSAVWSYNAEIITSRSNNNENLGADLRNKACCTQTTDYDRFHGTRAVSSLETRDLRVMSEGRKIPPAACRPSKSMGPESQGNYFENLPMASKKINSGRGPIKANIQVSREFPTLSVRSTKVVTHARVKCEGESIDFSYPNGTDLLTSDGGVERQPLEADKHQYTSRWMQQYPKPVDPVHLKALLSSPRSQPLPDVASSLQEQDLRQRLEICQLKYEILQLREAYLIDVLKNRCD
ncbi:unnamed protein product [Calicophoron daubneyi]|uniref:Uncharacterized protein n=1 Tax=Calicophoron daubneyi TaxID=300641 RepID=A0AAV2T350_CALDB